MMERFSRFTLLLLCTFVITGTSCKKQKSIIGKEFIEREVFVDILVDIHLADGVTNDRKFNRKFDADSIDVLSPILEKHQVTRQMFDTTLVVYSQNPTLFDQVYNDVLIKLNLMLDENDQQDPERGDPEDYE